MNNEKKSFVAAAFENDIDVTTGELTKALRKEFGSAMGFIEVKLLREAFVNRTFDRVWDEIFRDEESWAKSREKKARGDRRKKLVIRGRRGIDRDKVAIPDIQGHMVVYRSVDGFMNARQFDSRQRASDFVGELLRDGIAPAKIGWFRRNDIATKVAA